MALRIPGKTLEDNFKLADFQGDFNDLQRLLLLSIAQPKEVNMIGREEMEFVYDDGERKLYRFIKANNVIVKVIDLVNNKETIVNRR